MGHLYFGFGSNLDAAQMARRCPNAQLVGPAKLLGYRLDFVGYSNLWGGAVATVAKAQGARVSGILWQLDDEDLARLDICEGFPLVYGRKKLLVMQPDGRQRRAIVYIHHEQNRALPNAAYFRVIQNAYRKHGFSESNLVRALEGLV